LLDTERLLTDRERHYHRLFEHLPICIFVVDRTVTPAVIIEANRRAELVYACPAAELARMPVTQLVPEESSSIAAAILQRVEQGETVTAEATHQRPNGTRFPARVTAALDPTVTGQIIVAVEDITIERERRSEAEAIDAERHRIAQDIHDGVTQTLGALRFKSALWSHLAEGAPSGMRAAIDELQAALGEVIVDLRRAIFALRPTELEALGFFPALDQRINAFSDDNQVAARFELTGSPSDLPADYELPLFRIIQEALSNIARHAAASSVVVSLSVDTLGQVVLSMRDNGRGFDPGQPGSAGQKGHFGLRQMRERVQSLKGRLEICSVTGQGTELMISLPPLARENRHDQGLILDALTD